MCNYNTNRFGQLICTNLAQLSNHTVLNNAFLWSDFNFHKWKSMIQVIKVNCVHLIVLMI